jgi:hypothetical protein
MRGTSITIDTAVLTPSVWVNTILDCCDLPFLTFV